MKNLVKLVINKLFGRTKIAYSEYFIVIVMFDNGECKNTRFNDYQSAFRYLESCKKYFNVYEAYMYKISNL